MPLFFRIDPPRRRDVIGVTGASPDIGVSTSCLRVESQVSIR